MYSALASMYAKLWQTQLGQMEDVFLGKGTISKVWGHCVYHVNIKSILAHNFEEKKKKTDHNPLALCLTNQVLMADSRAQPSGQGAGG